MLSNLHTHSKFCDGVNTIEEIITSAIEKGFCSIGFSGHGYTDFDLSYCMKDTDQYVSEIKRLKEKYKTDIQIYTGIEEDAFHPVSDRSKFDYIIGSSHYLKVNNEYLPIDSDYDCFKDCLKAFNYDIIKLSEDYYSKFSHYINTRKPDIVGHFDLITKFDELDTSLFLENKDYNRIAEKYIDIASQSGCLFEVNTGAISRGYRKAPYPYENLLYILRKNGNGIVLSSDSHTCDTIDYKFEEMRSYLKDIGFNHIFVLYNNKFTKDFI